MRLNSFVRVLVAGVFFLSSCNNSVKHTNENKAGYNNKVLQQADGSISLKVEKADCYSDIGHPSNNTAEWNVFVTKSGRFDVWLSSATKDTNNMQYQNSVMLSIHDSRLETHPSCDKVIENSGEVSYPYFRADSFMGSLYIQDTGLYNIQLISEKIVPQGNNDDPAIDSGTKLLSVHLTPVIL